MPITNMCQQVSLLFALLRTKRTTEHRLLATLESQMPGQSLLPLVPFAAGGTRERFVVGRSGSGKSG